MFCFFVFLINQIKDGSLSRAQENNWNPLSGGLGWSNPVSPTSSFAFPASPYSLCISYSASHFVPKISGIYSSFKPLDLPGKIFQTFWLTSSCHLVLRAFMLIPWKGILSPTPYSIHIISYLGLLSFLSFSPFFLSLSFFLPPCLTPPSPFHFCPSIHLYISLSIVYIFIL